jgi:hypothetical protein
MYTAQVYQYIKQLDSMIASGDLSHHSGRYAVPAIVPGNMFICDTAMNGLAMSGMGSWDQPGGFSPYSNISSQRQDATLHTTSQKYRKISSIRT